VPLLLLLMVFIVPRLWCGHSGVDRDSPLLTPGFPECGLLFPLRGTDGALRPVQKSVTSCLCHNVTFPQVEKSVARQYW
jgi:hypothetical protein